MTYNEVHIYLSKWFPCFGQGWTLNSKRIFVKVVYDPTHSKVSIDSIVDVIQHELNHTEKIVEKGWIDFYVTEIWQYLFKAHDVAGYEPDAEKAEDLPNNSDLKNLVIDYCKKNKLRYY
jgi:hypothetical protein